MLEEYHNHLLHQQGYSAYLLSIFEATVAMRIAHVNHACQPNAAVVYDETARVAVLVALNDIQPGDEISIFYYFSFYVLHSRIRMPGMGCDPSIVQIEMKLGIGHNVFN